jgi:hypothetical protein
MDKASPTRSTGTAIDVCDERRWERHELGLSDGGGERYKFWKQRAFEVWIVKSSNATARTTLSQAEPPERR